MNFKKPLSVLILSGALLTAGALAPAEIPGVHSVRPAEAADITITINGSVVNSDVSPTIVNGRTLVPIRVISENVGAKVAWNQDTQTAVIAKDSTVLSMQYNKTTYFVNGTVKSMDTPVQMVSGRIMVPLRVAAETLGATVVWDDATRTVKITSTVSTGDPVPEVSLINKVRVLFDDVNLRAAATTDSASLGRVNTGDLITKIGTSGDWVQVQLSDGRTAYIAGWLVEAAASNTVSTGSTVTPALAPSAEPEPAPAPATIDFKVIVTGSEVNVRSGPGTTYEKLGSVFRGEVIHAIAADDGWYQVRLADGTEVWIADWLVSKDIAGVQAEIKNAANHPAPAPPSVDAASGTQMSVIEVKKETGQSWVTFAVGDANAEVLSNNGNTIKVKISGVNAPAGMANPVEGVSPFTGMQIANSGSDVIITTTVTDNGYFRLDRINNRFSIMAVAKHKNGQVGLAGKTIVIDPGHGTYNAAGKLDPGAISKHNGLSEIDFNVPLSNLLTDKLKAAGANVILTHGTEYNTMSLYDRAMVANNNSADAFISIHGDSASNTSAYGAGTWTYTGDLRLTSAAQKDIRNDFAQAINSELASTTGRPAYIKYANFAVTRESEVPSVLVEAGFLSNPDDAALLATAQYQETLAQALYNGFKKYFSF